MELLSLPPEIRVLIYDFCFPPPYRHVQLIPYRASSLICHLNLPLSLYRVCRLISNELPHLSNKLRSLNFLYIIQGTTICTASRPEYGPRVDDDPDLHHFQKMLEYAQRVRLVGAGRNKTRGRCKQSSIRMLEPGPSCAMRVLEVQPLLWSPRLVAHTLTHCLGMLTIHPDTVERLEIRLIRDDEGEGPNDHMDEIEEWLRCYQNTKTGQRLLLDDMGVIASPPF